MECKFQFRYKRVNGMFPTNLYVRYLTVINY